MDQNQNITTTSGTQQLAELMLLAAIALAVVLMLL